MQLIYRINWSVFNPEEYREITQNKCVVCAADDHSSAKPYLPLLLKFEKNPLLGEFSVCPVIQLPVFPSRFVFRELTEVEKKCK